MSERAICVTIATQRSGTKALGACFNSGVELLSLGEIFHESSDHPASFRRYISEIPDAADRLVSGYSESILDSYFIHISKLYKRIHFDLMYTNKSFITPLWFEGVDCYFFMSISNQEILQLFIWCGPLLIRTLVWCMQRFLVYFILIMEMFWIRIRRFLLMNLFWLKLRPSLRHIITKIILIGLLSISRSKRIHII